MLKSASRDIVNWQIKKRQSNCTKFSNLRDHNFKKRELETVRELSKICSQIVLKCLHLARIGRHDIQ